MSLTLKRPCTYPGCRALCDGGRCEAHQHADRRVAEQRRGTAASRGYGYKWQQARVGFLREHPLCVKHLDRGELVASTVVDHIVPHRGDMQLFWLRSNWQALCKDCHDVKTASEDGGFGNAGRPQTNADPG